ncbi:peptidylprolyl isomerase [Alteraurantiacibacter aestuarii]|uniref:peptidylprolyl isomerase n=1 Tax=Alteraurantiacibacter aestuarii TaxID=650004 RepID=A0A844ZGI1_9SPHN|nr:peptidylprolyl isomerase [Alteraurantiacibacter aestuarii]MXO87621.1 peptidylprolyl isomerase [Alteraurantiacibacter aestuarii]
MTLKRFAIFAPLLALATPALAQEAEGQATPPPATTQVVLETTMGDIVIALETQRAPITAANFLRYVEEDRFDGTVFYRAMQLDWGEQPNGLIQGGAQNDWDRILDPIAHEPTSETGVLHTRGAISMAMGEPGTANGDFSILLRDLPQLNANPDAEDPASRPGFAAFGHVVSGMDVVEAIHAAPIDPEKGEGWMLGQMLADPVVIVDARVVGDRP